MEIDARQVSLPEMFSLAHGNCRDVINVSRDQGRCSSCWAFAAAGVIDGSLCMVTQNFAPMVTSPENREKWPNSLKF